MSPIEMQVLRALADHYEPRGNGMFFNFASLAVESEVPRSKIRRTVRSLARKGFAEYGKGLWTEDGRPAGSGYRCTDTGNSVAEQS